MHLPFHILGGRHEARNSVRRTQLALEALEARDLPSTLSGFVYNDANNNGVKDAGETGLAGVTVTLTGTDSLGHAVNLTGATDANGAYRFANLGPGTYALREAQPASFLFGQSTVGTLGGSATPGSLANILLDGSADGSAYNFGNLARSDGWTAIASNFNGTAIPAGNTLWFSSVFKANGIGSTPVTLHFTNQTISFTANGSNVTLSVPDATVTFSPSASSATTAFDAATGTWATTLPTHFSGNGFLSGVAFPVTSALPGGIKNVTWQGKLTSDTAGVSVNWQWASAVYTNFGSDYNALNVKPVDDNQVSQYKDSDHAGTPEAFRQWVVGGAMGGGGSNFTGSYSATASVAPPVSSPPASLSGEVFNQSTGAGLGGVTVTLTGTNNLGQSVTLTTTTAANGTYSFTGLLPGTYTVSAAPLGSFVNSSDQVGTVNGVTDGSALSLSSLGNINLAAGVLGLNYNFGETLFSGS
jgi:large repetitive protein